MKKTAAGILAALIVAVSGCAALLTALPNSTIASSGSIEITDDGISEETDELTEEELQELEEAREEAVEFALENEDPQYGRYLQSLEDYEEASEDAGVTDLSALEEQSEGIVSLTYSNSSLTHNSKFSSMTKVWGIDVSYYQYDIDWSKVKADGITFAIIRVGYRGYGSSGQLVEDYKFEENIEGAINAGLEVGVYFYTQAITATEAKEEADFVLNRIKSYDLDMPVYFDIESVDYATGRLDSAGLTKTQKTNLCKAFCQRIEDNGYDAGVYANKYWLTSMIDGEGLSEDYDIWLAHYTTATDYSGTYNTWQFTGSGSISGISTAVDIDVDYRSGSSSSSSDTQYSVKNLTATVSGNSVSLSWTAVSGAGGYEVYRAVSENGTYQKRMTVTTTSYKNTNLTAGKTYYYKVRCLYYSSSTISYGPYSSVSATAKPATVSVPTHVSSGGTNVVVSWSAVSGASGYEVAILNSSTGKYEVKKTVSSGTLKAQLTGLKANTAYKIKVRAYVTVDGAKVYGSYSPCKTCGTACAYPRNFYASATPTAVTLTWDKSVGAASYDVYEYKNGSYVKLGSTTNLTYTINAAPTGLKRVYAVKAVSVINNRTLYSIYSQTASLVASKPAAPAISSSSATFNTVKLTWNKVSGASGYRIYKYDTSKKTYVKVTTVYGDTTTSYTVKSLVPNTEYKFKVKAFTKSTNSIFWGTASSAYSAVTTPKASFKAASSGSGSVTLTWNQISDASGYRLYRYDETKKTYVKVVTLFGTAKCSYTVSSLSSGSSYKFKVKAFRKDSGSTYWGTASSAYAVSIS